MKQRPIALNQNDASKIARLCDIYDNIKSIYSEGIATEDWQKDS